MEFSKLEDFQNDEIVRDQLKKDFEFLEWIIVSILWETENTEQYRDYNDFIKEKTKIYESLYEIKNNLENEWLNLSLIYNRLAIIIYNILWNIPSSESIQTIETQWHFFKLQKYLEDILKYSWVDISVLKDVDNFKWEIEKIVYSK